MFHRLRLSAGDRHAAGSLHWAVHAPEEREERGFFRKCPVLTRHRAEQAGQGKTSGPPSHLLGNAWTFGEVAWCPQNEHGKWGQECVDPAWLSGPGAQQPWASHLTPLGLSPSIGQCVWLRR